MSLFLPPEPQSRKTLLRQARACESVGEDSHALKLALEALNFGDKDAKREAECGALAQELRQRLERADYLKTQGNRAFAANNLAEAHKLYTEALSHFRTHTDALSNRAACRLKQGEYEAAVEDCQLALRIEPGRGKCVWRAAKALLALNRPTQAAQMIASASASATDGKVTAADRRALAELAEEAAKMIADPEAREGFNEKYMQQVLSKGCAPRLTHRTDRSTTNTAVVTEARGVRGNVFPASKALRQAPEAAALAARALTAQACAAFRSRGFVTLDLKLSAAEATELSTQAKGVWDAGYCSSNGQQTETRVRGDKVAWLSDAAARPYVPALANALAVLHCLAHELDQRCDASAQSGGSSFYVPECAMFAGYPNGASYRAHRDAVVTRGEWLNDRCVTIILYLNEGWAAKDGGALRIYPLVPPEHDAVRGARDAQPSYT